MHLDLFKEGQNWAEMHLNLFKEEQNWAETQ